MQLEISFTTLSTPTSKLITKKFTNIQWGFFFSALTSEFHAHQEPFLFKPKAFLRSTLNVFLTLNSVSQEEEGQSRNV